MQTTTIVPSTATGFQSFKGIEYIMIDVANQYGLDKETFETRIQFVKDQEANLEVLANKADAPELYIKAVSAYRDTQQGIATGHMVGLDGVFSGLQVMSTLLGCEKSATFCGLVDPDVRKDSYTLFQESYNENHPFDISFTRNQLKSAVMKNGYGSTAEPVALFGEDTPELAAFYATKQREMPAAVTYADAMLPLWDSEALHHEWTLPDGFVAHVKVLATEPVRVEVDGLGSFTHLVTTNQAKTIGDIGTKGLLANGVQSVDGFVIREMNRRCNYDATLAQEILFNLDLCMTVRGINPSTFETDTKQFLATNYVMLVNESNVNQMSDNTLVRAYNRLTQMLQHKSFPVLGIHDCFLAHANNCNVVRLNYNEILAEICESEMFEDIYEQLAGARPTLIKDAGLADKIRNSNYALS